MSPLEREFSPVLNYSVMAESTSGDMDYNFGLLQQLADDLLAQLKKLTGQFRSTDVARSYGGVTCRPGYQPLADVLCVACPPGTYWDYHNGLHIQYRNARCMPCPLGHYQSQEAQTSCLACPSNQTTVKHGSYNLSQCVGYCPAGHWSYSGLAPCHTCPQGTYTAFSPASYCENCEPGQTTARDGATHKDECYAKCPRGSIRRPGGGGAKHQCRRCYSGTYQALEDQTSCNLFASPPLSNHRTCEHAAYLCYNGGTCVEPQDASGSLTCDCPPGFTNDRCEKLVCPPNACLNFLNPDESSIEPWQYSNPCLSAPCLNGGSCMNMNETSSYQCSCRLGYSGTRCENPVLLCRGRPCVHGTCDNGWCACDFGFAGVYCNTTVDACWLEPQAPGCDPGPTVNPCWSQPCALGSTCLPTPEGGHVCKCHPQRSGPHCADEAVLELDMEYGLEPRLGWDVTLPAQFMPSLTALTLCLWIRPSPLTSYFTIVTLTSADQVWHNLYKSNYPDGTHVAFALKQTEHIKIFFLNDTLKAEVAIPLKVWTHVCFTWAQRGGHWQVFLNGTRAASGKFNEDSNQALPGNLSVTIAPRNSTLDDWLIFLGRISQFNVFSRVLSPQEIGGLANPASCHRGYHGDVISWTNVLPYALATKSSLCLDVNECWFPEQFICPPPANVCRDKLGSYTCLEPQSLTDSRASLRLYLEVAGAAVVAVAAIFVFGIVSHRRRKRHSRRMSPGTTRPPGVQLRQSTGTTWRQAREDQASSNTQVNGNSRTGVLDRTSRSPIVRPSPGTEAHRGGVLRETPPVNRSRQPLPNETLAQTVVSEGAPQGSTERGDQFDGDCADAGYVRGDSVLNNAYSFSGREEVLYLTDREAVPSTTDATGFSNTGQSPRRHRNSLDFLRSKFQSLRFGKLGATRPLRYSHLQEFTESSTRFDPVTYDTPVEDEAGAEDLVMDDPYLAASGDGGQEGDNSDNLPGATRPAGNTGSGD